MNGELEKLEERLSSLETIVKERIRKRVSAGLLYDVVQLPLETESPAVPSSPQSHSIATKNQESPQLFQVVEKSPLSNSWGDWHKNRAILLGLIGCVLLGGVAYLYTVAEKIKAVDTKQKSEQEKERSKQDLLLDRERSLAQQLVMGEAQRTREEELRKNADRDVGTDAYKAGRFNEALALLKPLAEEGDAWAQHLLGMIYLNPYGVSGFSKDVLEADIWFAKAAEQGLDSAQHSLGRRCFRQEGVSKDYAECARWMRKAAEQGHANAQHDLADMYSEGVGVQRDQLEAKEWYRKAADQGHEQAQLKLKKIERSNSPLYERELWPGGPKFVIEPPEWR